MVEEPTENFNTKDKIGKINKEEEEEEKEEEEEEEGRVEKSYVRI